MLKKTYRRFTNKEKDNQIQTANKNIASNGYDDFELTPEMEKEYDDAVKQHRMTSTKVDMDEVDFFLELKKDPIDRADAQKRLEHIKQEAIRRGK